MSYEQRMTAAIALLDTQEKPNYSAAARKFNLGRTAVTCRFEGKTTSRAEANSEYRQLLTIAQEDALIARINNLTDRNMPPTSHMVKNMAEEIRGDEVNKNWTSHFIQRHKDVLKSLYLRNIDNKRASSEYEPMFKLFFDLVKRPIILLYLYYTFEDKYSNF
jgi:Tc5 transposase-like DNA-binding protein